MNNKPNEQLGRELAEKAGTRVYKAISDGFFRYILDSKDTPVEYLCTSLDAIAEIEKIIVEEVGGYQYAQALKEIWRRTEPSVKVWMGTPNERAKECHACGYLAVSTARQRAEACLLALTEKI